MKKKQDLFANSNGYKRWIMAEIAKEKKRELLLNKNLNRTAKRYPRAFSVAYEAMLQLDPKKLVNRKEVHECIGSKDPGGAILSWFMNTRIPSVVKKRKQLYVHLVDFPKQQNRNLSR